MSNANNVFQQLIPMLKFLWSHAPQRLKYLVMGLALLAGMSREAALEFSFFLSMPTMMMATTYDMYKAVKGGADNPLGAVTIDQHGWFVLAIGFVTSFIVAYGSVAWLLSYVRRQGFAIFAVYRIVLGAAVLAVAW